jgi:hypothetical protein
MRVYKKIGYTYYFHMAAAHLQPKELKEILSFAEGLSIMTQGGSDIIIKVNIDVPRVSFLEYVDFWADPHPRLWMSTIFYQDHTSKTVDFSAQSNPPILHRKETLIPSHWPEHLVWSGLTAQEKAAGLFKDTKRIGRLKQWQELLDEKGLYYHGHLLKKRDE